MSPEQRLDSWGRRLQNLFEVGLYETGAFQHWLHWPWLDSLLAGLGLVAIVCIIVQRDHSFMLRRGYSFILIWFLVAAVGILYWTPFSWWRWYLPLAPCWAILEGIGLTFVLMQGWRAWQRLRVQISAQAQ